MNRFFVTLFLTLPALAAEPTFQLLDFPGAASTQTWGINARGDIIGFYSAGGASHGLLLSGGKYTSIDYPGAAVTLLNGINARGDIAGEFGTTATGPHRGFILTTDGIYTPVDYPGATATTVLGIAAGGELVGLYTLPDNSNHPFLWNGGKFSPLEYPGATGTVANGISPGGEVVGGFTAAGVSHGFLWNNGKFTQFDYPNAAFTTATGMNDAGVIVGRYRDAAGVNHGFTLLDGKFAAIDVPNASFTGATAINPAGDILGRCTINGATHGFLLLGTRPQLRYSFTDLGPVGSAPGQPYVLTDNRLLSGAALGEDAAVHAVVWMKGKMIDLGTSGLGGRNSIAFGINARGTAAGAAESASIDAGGEDFCGFRTNGYPSDGNSCIPVLWQSGTMTALPTLGGANGEASWINNRGEIAGAAETTRVDPGCPSPQRFQFRPVLWERGRITELPTFGSDFNGYAFTLNDNGEIAGASGDCSALQPNGTYLQSRHALLWRAGQLIDLGNLGGTGTALGNLALGINNRTEVVGGSDLPGDQTTHAFLWTPRTGMQDLGALPGDVASVGLGINDASEIVGISFDADFNSRAFLWRNGVMTDLNDLAGSEFGMTIVLSCSINNRGELAGISVDADGKPHGFLAVPTPSQSLQ